MWWLWACIGGPDPYADRIVSFEAGPGAGFGAEDAEGAVLGPPSAPAGDAGSLGVLSLGHGGEIVLAFDDLIAVDGPGPDLLVFENGFPGWFELAEVALSEDGETWVGLPCLPEEDHRGCVGVGQVFANPELGIDPTDPEVAGGDPLDLADFGMSEVRYVRITDLGSNPDTPPAAGFDLDALAVVNARRVE
jgi:hypothetical protein